MCVNNNQGGAPNYYPNSFSGPEPIQRAAVLEPPLKVSRDVYRYDSGNEDNFTQPRIFWNSVLDDTARERLVSNIADSLMNALVFIQERAVSNFAEVSADIGVKLKKALQVKLSQKV